MPQLNNGGKWIFGWVIVRGDLLLQVPPEAYEEYGFQPDQEINFTKGSRRSGGFGVGKPVLLSSNERIRKRIVAKTSMGEKGQFYIPFELGIKPDTRLLAVRGSNYALGFLVRGPIVEEALLHPEIEVFCA